jgi:RimJ/RimL family protein N-acetyltransferase
MSAVVERRRTMDDLLVRPLSPSDRPAVAFGFRHLGERSRYQRFLRSKSELGPQELAYMVDVDHWHHEALIAFSPPPRTPIGVACYVRCEMFDAAEIAISVVDDWQRAGVGRALLLDLRARAIAAGIRRFTGTVLADNRGAHALARRLGRYRVVRIVGGVVEVEVELGRA